MCVGHDGTHENHEHGGNGDQQRQHGSDEWGEHKADDDTHTHLHGRQALQETEGVVCCCERGERGKEEEDSYPSASSGKLIDETLYDTLSSKGTSQMATAKRKKKGAKRGMEEEGKKARVVDDGDDDDEDGEVQVRFPVARVKKIVAQDETLGTFRRESVVLIAKAAELFAEYL